MATTFASILDFVIPIGVWIFLAWVIYRIPIVKEGVQKFRGWLQNRREGREGQEDVENFYKTIDYE